MGSNNATAVEPFGEVQEGQGLLFPWVYFTWGGSDISKTEAHQNPLKSLFPVHVAETVVKVVVKDINDNAPVFPNTTMYGEVQENGPISNGRCIDR